MGDFRQQFRDYILCQWENQTPATNPERHYFGVAQNISTEALNMDLATWNRIMPLYYIVVDRTNRINTKEDPRAIEIIVAFGGTPPKAHQGQNSLFSEARVPYYAGDSAAFLKEMLDMMWFGNIPVCVNKQIAISIPVIPENKAVFDPPVPVPILETSMPPERPSSIDDSIDIKKEISKKEIIPSIIPEAFADTGESEIVPNRKIGNGIGIAVLLVAGIMIYSRRDIKKMK